MILYLRSQTRLNIFLKKRNVLVKLGMDTLFRYLLKFHDGSTKWYLPTEPDAAKGRHVVSITLPSDVVCQQCVIQWRYRTGKTFYERNFFVSNDQNFSICCCTPCYIFQVIRGVAKMAKEVLA